MKKCLISRLMTVSLVLMSISFAHAAEFEDVIYLKNGSIIRGIIVEQMPQEGTYAIKTLGGSVFVFNSTEIEKVTREPQLYPTPIRSTAYPIPDKPASLAHAIGVASWVLTVANPDAGPNEKEDERYGGGALSYQFAFNDHLAIRLNFYSAEHENFRDLTINGLNGQIILTTNARDTGFKFYLGAGYFDEKWDNGRFENTYTGSEFIFGLGYNWSRIGLDLTGAGRSQSDYDVPADSDLLFVTSTLRLTFRF